MSLVPRESGALSTGDDMNAILGILVDRVPGVNAAVIFHGSGLALSGVATCLDEVDVVAEEASALGAGLMEAASAALEATATGGSGGGFRSVWVRNDEQSMYCVQIGEDAYAAASTDPDVPAGLLMYRMDKWAKKARSAFEKYGEIDIPEEALPKRRHSHIQHDRPALKAREVSSADLGPIGTGSASVEDGSVDGSPEGESDAAGPTALYAAAMAATTVGLADGPPPVDEPVVDEPVVDESATAAEPFGDWIMVDVPEPPAREPELAPTPEPVVTPALGAAAPPVMFGLAPEPVLEESTFVSDAPVVEDRPALADAMEAWMTPPPPAAPALPEPEREPEVRPARPPAPSTYDLSFAPAPSGGPVAGFPPPVAAPPVAAAPSGGPVAGFPPPVAAPPVQFPRPAEAVWAPAPPEESGAPGLETSPWAAYGGPPPGGGR